jgi:hypothetical protein
MITVSLKQILEKSPCLEGWAKVLHGQGKITKVQLDECLESEHVPMSYSKLACDTQFPLSAILESNDLSDCLWALRCADNQYYPLMRKFAVWCARQVQHLMKDQRSLDSLDVAWRHSDGLATDQKMAAAWDAAWDAAMDAAWDAAWDAARAAARAAAWDAAWDAARAAARAAAWDAARAAARAAAWDAARDAAWDAARAAAWDAARDAQAEKLKQILDLGYWVD